MFCSRFPSPRKKKVGGPLDHGPDGDGAKTAAGTDNDGQQDHEDVFGHLGAFNERCDLLRQYGKQRLHFSSQIVVVSNNLKTNFPPLN